jgi:hypothetical protein
MASADINRSLGIPDELALVPPRSSVDMRFDWRNFMSIRDVSFDMFVSATNLFDQTDVISRNTFTNLCGCIGSQFTEPRTVFAGLKAKF